MIAELLIDPQLKWWMLLPISVAMVLVGLLRSNVTYLVTPKPKLEPLKSAREKSFLQRVSGFKKNFNVLNAEEFEARRNYFIEKLKSTEYYAKIEDPNAGPQNPFGDAATSDALMNMAKGNLMSYVPQTLIMGWVNFFFAGSIVMKLPFPLTEGFKSMLQTGVNTPNLDAQYVSAISWYFVNLFGLRGVYSLLMDDPAAAAELINQQQQNIPNIGAPGGPKAEKVFNAEADSLQILDHESLYTGIAQRILQKYDKQ
ncbi:putative ER membrane protein complex subunit [Clavispora lusitaniae]|uniref:ER membrane protein complex subunit 3 n=1 Tax=Clavispora lusitaniae TaxID=36911 RepID=A0AA91T2J7_CLALS|nr:putative ER membrane protein complex subunit [Clavispora lusitaniae]